MEVKENVSQQVATCNTLENGGENSPDAGVLEEIKAKIKGCLDTSNDSYREIGRLLLEAKSQFGKYGEWLNWLQDNVDISICKAQRLMRVAKWMDGNEAPVPHSNLAQLGFTKAYILSRLTTEDLKTFLVDKQLENMSKRELQEAVRNYLHEKASQPSTDVGTNQPQGNVSTDDEFLKRFEKLQDDVLKLADFIKDKPNEYGSFAAEFREFVIQQLPPEDSKKD